uniref:Uncharacterized protein n=1 Tax=Rhizophora mucronata TaxID=61149 RepID=A0A2P2NRY6_RHIMU
MMFFLFFSVIVCWQLHKENGIIYRSKRERHELVKRRADVCLHPYHIITYNVHLQLMVL